MIFMSVCIVFLPVNLKPALSKLKFLFRNLYLVVFYATNLIITKTVSY